MKAIAVLRPGFYTTLQDLGRPGFRELGIPPSGALDEGALGRANRRVGNDPGAGALEITLGGGLRLRALADLQAALAGAELSAQLEGRPLTAEAAFFWPRGTELTFGRRRAGCRAYLAVAGGFDGEKFMGSCSVYEPGFMGRPLQSGDVIAVREGKLLPPADLPAPLLPALGGTTELLAIPGPQFDWFGPEGWRNFWDEEYRVSSLADRKGYRLAGPPISRRSGEMVSEPVLPGSIQIPGDGQPIILMKDGPTVGGYPKIATLLHGELDRLAQLAPGDALRFRPASLESLWPWWENRKKGRVNLRVGNLDVTLEKK